MNTIKLPHAELSGLYKLEVRRHGELIHDTGWFDNLITDTGLNALGQSVNISAYAMVGTSNTVPAVTDTVLGGQIASKDTSTAPGRTTSQGVEVSGARYGWMRVSCPFAQGAVVGNIAEVGIGWTSTQVFSRSLVTPAISIIAIDQLTVVYELRMYLPTTNVTGSVVIGGVTYNYTVRPNQAANAGSAGTGTRGWAPTALILGASARQWVQASYFQSWWGAVAYGAPAALQTDLASTSITTSDGGGVALNSGIATAVTNAAYTDSSFTCQFTCSWGIDDGNLGGGVTWLARTSGTANALKGVAYGAGRFVAVGAAGTIISSSDSESWATESSGTANALNAVVFASSKFVAVGAAGTILTSPDGDTWTPQTSGTANALNGVAFGGGLFVAVGAAGTILTSPDGVAWTPQTSGTAAILYAVTHGAGIYVAVGAGGVLHSSPNATAWTPRTSGTASDLLCVGYGIGLFIASGPANFTTRSIDGFSWTTGTTGYGVQMRAIAFTGILATMVGGSSIALNSSNGSSWVNCINQPGTYNALTVGQIKFVAVGDAGVISTASTGGIQAFTYSAIFGSYQCVLDGTIEKDNTKTLSITWSQTWARRP